jgi:hypothetical protein
VLSDASALVIVRCTDLRWSFGSKVTVVSEVDVLDVIVVAVDVVETEEDVTVETVTVDTVAVDVEIVVVVKHCVDGDGHTPFSMGVQKKLV